ncbi:ribosome recycling factor [Candidatus Gracilibacteria bacterium]|nr:ribosome recycling factor [Candidatus Gracilibacteria bacterium]
MHSSLVGFKQSVQAATDHLKSEFTQVQAGRASTALVENLMVESYGSMMPLKSVATITTPDASTVSIQPWDKGLASAIEKAIQLSPLGLNPQNNGGVVLLPIPKPTEEKRRDLVKSIKQMSEDSKVQLRTARHDALAIIKKEKDDGALPEDQFFQIEKDLQKLVDEGNKAIEELLEKKSQEILTI